MQQRSNDQTPTPYDRLAVIIGGGGAAIAIVLDPTQVLPFIALGGGGLGGLWTLYKNSPLVRRWCQRGSDRIVALLEGGSRHLLPAPSEQDALPAAAPALPRRRSTVSPVMSAPAAPPHAVPAPPPPQHTYSNEGAQGQTFSTPTLLQELLERTVAEQGHANGAPEITFHPQLAQAWMETNFPGLPVADLQPLETTGSSGTPVARTPLNAVAAITRSLIQSGAEVRDVMLGLDEPSASIPGTICVALWVLDQEPPQVDKFRRSTAAVASREYTGDAGGWSLIMVLAKPCGYGVAAANGEDMRMRRQRRLLDALPVAPSLLQWQKREQWAANTLRIPLGIVVTEDSAPRTYWFDLRAQTHLGVFARTGAGKDAGITAWLFIMLLTHGPEYLSIACLDPKGADYQFLNLVPHALFPVAISSDEIRERVEELASLVAFRGRLLGEALPGGMSTIDDYNALPLAERQEAWETVTAMWQEEAPYQPPGFPGILSHVLLVVTECNAPVFGEGDVDSTLQAIIKQGRAVGLHLVVTAQQGQGLVRLRSQIAVMACGPVRTLRDGTVVLARNDNQGEFVPHKLPVPNREKPETLGVFVLADDDEMLMRSFYLAPDERKRLVERFAAASNKRPRKTARPLAAPAPAPAPLPDPEAPAGAPSDTDIWDWVRGYRQEHGSLPSQREACRHFFGSDNSQRKAFFRRAFSRLGITREEVVA